MPNRYSGGNEYRYSFQGQEMDEEIKGEGNSINYKYRMHDPRVGRFFSVDPLTAEYSYNSPYAFSENRVIDAIELEGLESQLLIKVVEFNKSGIAKVDESKTIVKQWRHTKYAMNHPNKTGRPQYSGSWGVGDYIVYVDSKTGEPIKNKLIKLQTENGVEVTQSGYKSSSSMGIKEALFRVGKKIAYDNYGAEFIDADYTESTYGDGDGITNPDIAKEEHASQDKSTNGFDPEVDTILNTYKTKTVYNKDGTFNSTSRDIITGKDSVVKKKDADNLHPIVVEHEIIKK